MLALFLRAGEEGPLANGVRMVVDQPVDKLIAQVAHPQPIGVGKGQGESHPPAVGLVDGAPLGVEQFLYGLS